MTRPVFIRKNCNIFSAYSNIFISPKMYTISCDSNGYLYCNIPLTSGKINSFSFLLQITKLENDCIELFNPIETSTNYFIKTIDNEIKITKNIEDFIAIPNENIDYKFVINNIIKEENYIPDTIWKDIKKLLPGSGIRIILNSSRKIRFQISDCLDELMEINSADSMTLLAEEIHQRAIDVSAPAIVVSFSGGRDSTGLLVAAKSQRRIPVSAITWTYDNGSAHEDLIASRTFTEKFDIPHDILNIDPLLLLEKIKISDLTSSICTSVAFHQYNKKFNELALSRYGKGALMLNGHGGDHLFLDPVPREVITDARKSGLWPAFRALRMLSRLNAVNPYALWRNQVWEHQNQLKRAEIFLTPVALDLLNLNISQEKKTAKEIHHKYIKQAILQNSTLKKLPTELNYFHPFTSPQLIASVWNRPVIDFYDSYRTRIPFQNSFEKFSNYEIKLRRDKGHMTGAYQRAIKAKKKILIDLIGNGYLHKEKLLNFDNTMIELSRSASGYIGIEGILLKILCFELMMRAN